MKERENDNHTRTKMHTRCTWCTHTRVATRDVIVVVFVIVLVLVLVVFASFGLMSTVATSGERRIIANSSIVGDDVVVVVVVVAASFGIVSTVAETSGGLRPSDRRLR